MISTKGFKAKNAFTIQELVVVISVFLIMFIILTPFVNMAKARQRRINCANNLMHISLGLHRYAADHDGTFPQNLGALYPDYVENEKVFDCPGTKPIGTAAKPDYDYISGLTENSSPKEILVKDHEGNHKKSGGNILRLNGSVTWAAR